MLKAILDGSDFTCSGRRILNVAKLVENPPGEIRTVLVDDCPRSFTVIHGDAGFPNTLIQLPSAICKLVDPRGSFGSTNGAYGDPYYDVAKINHSLEGYDFIVNDMFDVKIQGNDLALDVHYPEGYQRVIDRFRRTFFPPTGPFDERRVRLVTALLFASMLPLHPIPRRQLAMYLTASRLFT